MLLRNRMAVYPSNARYDMSYLQSNVTAFDKSGNAATKIALLQRNNGRFTGVGGLNPVISRRTYNGTKVIMSSLIYRTVGGKVITYFSTLQNNSYRDTSRAARYAINNTTRQSRFTRLPERQSVSIRKCCA